MTRGAEELLAGWIAENVQAVPDEEVEREAARLAAEFAAYAKDAGLSASDLAELEVDIGEDLRSHMKEALADATPGEDDAPSDGPE
jgi:hypothetical protein